MCSGDLSSFPRTRYQGYDPYGRAGRILSADGSFVDFAYRGVRQVKRTVKVATGSSGGETAIQTVERYDPHGRLRKVIENFNTPNSIATDYTYQVGGRLRHVVMGPQERIFSWDGRAFLQWEQHPELVDNINDLSTGR